MPNINLQRVQSNEEYYTDQIFAAEEIPFVPTRLWSGVVLVWFYFLIKGFCSLTASHGVRRPTVIIGGRVRFISS